MVRIWQTAGSAGYGLTGMRSRRDTVAMKANQARMQRSRALAALNANRHAFMTAVGGVVEHSPWVAERAFVYKPFSSVDALHAALMKCIRDASTDEQIALFNVHPELAGREAVAGTMTADSTGEQGRLGLTALSAEELAELTVLNRRYREKFGFPFIAALRLHADRHSMIASFKERIENPRETEIGTAIGQIGEIVRGRLEKLFNP
jgi:2-oxo-4-hydroxy-4-carboxy-5-ureidoimidazoline decarboxylase